MPPVSPDIETRPTGVYLRVDGARALAHRGRAVPLPRRPSALVARLETRLALERHLARTFEAIVGKHGRDEVVAGGPTRADLERLRDDELRLVGLLERALTELGHDPTARPVPLRPTRTSTVEAILADPRSTLAHALDALASIELAANDEWMVLADLMAESGRHEIAAAFTRAMNDEDRALATLQAWHRRLTARVRARAA